MKWNSKMHAETEMEKATHRASLAGFFKQEETKREQEYNISSEQEMQRWNAEMEIKHMHKNGR